MAADIYTQVAPYYDLIHARLTQDIGFSLSLAARNRGPVLELGCGTGRLLIPLARAGHRIIGLDNSVPMLLRAQRALDEETTKVRQQAQLVVGDMTTFVFAPAHFSLILVPYNTFMHLDATAALAAVRAAARHLQPGGRLFLDLANPFAVEQTPGDALLSLEQILTDPNSGTTVAIMAANRLNADAQRLNISWIYDASPAGGGPVERSVAQVVYHYLFPHQIELLLQQSALRLEALYGNYNEAPFEEAAERLLVLAQKPG